VATPGGGSLASPPPAVPEPASSMLVIAAFGILQCRPTKTHLRRQVAVDFGRDFGRIVPFPAVFF